MISKKIEVLGDTIEKLLTIDADENLKNLLARSHAADLAMILPRLEDARQLKILKLLGSGERRAAVLAELHLGEVAPLLKRLGAERAAEILNDVPPDDLADILAEMPAKLSEEILSRLKKEDAKEVEDLIRHESDTAGGIMSPDFFTLSEDLTAGEAIQKIQESHGEGMESLFYVYIINPQGHLVGVLSLKKLILASPQKPIAEIMDKDPVRVRLDEDQEEVAKTVSRYNFLSLPVVDDTNRLVGVITVDDVIDVIKEEAAEDMLLIAGAGKEAAETGSLWEGLRKRIPWFLTTLVGGLVAAEIIAYFFTPEKNIHWLAMFIPLVLRMSISAGTQSMTVVTSSLLGERMGSFHGWRLFWKELRMAVIMGLFFGLLVALFVYFRWGNLVFAEALSFSLLITMLIAVVLGSFIPLLFQRLGVDPAIIAGVLATTLITVVSVFAYFSVGRVLFSR